ncbi:hypothetical protein CLERM_763 [Coxiella-like endosymbiont]|nr:hypothetical protein CLERM_763 [Coxiella-like endosymbiont]
MFTLGMDGSPFYESLEKDCFSLSKEVTLLQLIGLCAV